MQAWRPHLKKDSARIEAVQRRATRMIPTLKGLSYHQRLSLLNLTTLETKRLRGDFIEVFKILKGFNEVNYSSMFSLAANNFRAQGHGLKVYKSRFNTNIGKFYFFPSSGR